MGGVAVPAATVVGTVAIMDTIAVTTVGAGAVTVGVKSTIGVVVGVVVVVRVASMVRERHLMKLQPVQRLGFEKCNNLLSICLTTFRKEPRFQLLIDSLWRAALKHPSIQWEFLCIDGVLWYSGDTRRKALYDAVDRRFSTAGNSQTGWRASHHYEPKPSVWQGPSRLTKQDYWDACSARNTAICYAKGLQIVFVDDCIEVPEDWLYHHDLARRGQYVLAGAFNDAGKPVADCDHRVRGFSALAECPPSWTFGMNVSFPIAALLDVNGYDEAYSGQAGVEDCDIGIRLARAGYSVQFSPEACVTMYHETHDPVCRQPPKERMLADGKSHYANEFLIQTLYKHPSRTWTLDNRYALYQLRKACQQGKSWPVPTAPTHDWRDGQPLTEM